MPTLARAGKRPNEQRPLLLRLGIRRLLERADQLRQENGPAKSANHSAATALALAAAAAASAAARSAAAVRPAAAARAAATLASAALGAPATVRLSIVVQHRHGIHWLRDGMDLRTIPRIRSMRHDVPMRQHLLGLSVFHAKVRVQLTSVLRVRRMPDTSAIFATAADAAAARAATARAAALATAAATPTRTGIPVTLAAAPDAAAAVAQSTAFAAVRRAEDAASSSAVDSSESAAAECLRQWLLSLA